MEEWKIGYLAGMIDGEGCIFVNQNRNRSTPIYHLGLLISNTNLQLLQYLQKDFGGTIYTGGSPGIKNKQGYRLSWAGHNTKAILARVYDKLFIKKEQAKLALDFPVLSVGQWGTPPEILKLKEEVYIKMKELNKKGITWIETTY